MMASRSENKMIQFKIASPRANIIEKREQWDIMDKHHNFTIAWDRITYYKNNHAKKYI